jgi:hypothetical protein
MFCTECGLQLQQGQKFCSECGKAAATAAVNSMPAQARPYQPPPVQPMPVQPERPVASPASAGPAVANPVHSRIKMLGMLWLGYAGFALVQGMSMQMTMNAAAPMMSNMPGMFGGTGMGLATMMIGARAWQSAIFRVALAVVAGASLTMLQRWSRWAGIVAAVLCALSGPVGMLLAIWTFVVLFRPSTVEGYKRLAG